MAILNRSGEDLGFTLQECADTLNQYSEDIARAWGRPTKLLCYPAEDFAPHTWALLFVNLSDVEDALAYHDVTSYGTPLAKVFVDTIRQAGEDLMVSASHEFAETSVDPDVNQLVHGPGRGLYSKEVCDPCEES